LRAAFAETGAARIQQVEILPNRAADFAAALSRRCLLRRVSAGFGQASGFVRCFPWNFRGFPVHSPAQLPRRPGAMQSLSQRIPSE
jgi:hypothetical protein